MTELPLPTQPFRDEHTELMTHVEHIRQAAGEVARVSPEERQLIVERILGFLRDTLVPHALVEEEVLYPEWARLVGSTAAAAPMVHDHEAILVRIDALAEVDPGDVDRLQEFLYGLYALIGVHFRKEEAVQLPALDANPEVAIRVLDRMGSHTHPAH